MALKRYDAEVNGIVTTLQLEESEAKELGLTESKPAKKAASAPANKAAAPTADKRAEAAAGAVGGGSK